MTTRTKKPKIGEAMEFVIIESEDNKKWKRFGTFVGGPDDEHLASMYLHKHSKFDENKYYEYVELEYFKKSKKPFC